MRTITSLLREIELDLHTLETATPRNSATVDRGSFEIVDEGSLIAGVGGTILFSEGGSAQSSDFSIEDGEGWMIGTERRGSSIFVLNDIPNESMTVTTANSSVVYEEIELTPDTPMILPIGESSLMKVQIFHTSPDEGTITVGDHQIVPAPVIKSQMDQFVHPFMGSYIEDIVVLTTMPRVQVRVSRITVHNAA